MNEKQCSKCKRTQVLSVFQVWTGGCKDGRYHQCKECQGRITAKRDEILEHMIELTKVQGDCEVSHEEADDLMIEAMTLFDPQLAKAYQKVRKWYG
ncbi:hypothetical protein LCGC14_0542390 [marine sediment metagenome]|uniref:Uncharacterized protein n=1 Tax=marine sediment metagenome TaxID=412755 RepID=A0A0F9RX54_9ZZZZ